MRILPINPELFQVKQFFHVRVPLALKFRNTAVIYLIYYSNVHSSQIVYWSWLYSFLRYSYQLWQRWGNRSMPGCISEYQYLEDVTVKQILTTTVHVYMYYITTVLQYLITAAWAEPRCLFFYYSGFVEQVNYATSLIMRRLVTCQMVH